jgi:5-methylcytosine-specific restriction protein B
MARWNALGGDKIYPVIERWRDECLINDSSLLFDEPVWTDANIAELYERFNAKPILGDETFEQKLKQQLEGAETRVFRLAAEALAIYFAFACQAVGEQRKLQLIEEVLEWGGDPLPRNSDVAKAMAGGIGNPGQGFNQQRWRHFAYVVDTARRIKELPVSERAALLNGDAFEFRRWLYDGDDGEQMGRHLLTHLLFPDSFERIAALTHKERIAEAFSELADGGDSDDLDATILSIRRKLEVLLPEGCTGANGEVSFYWPPLSDGWGRERVGEATGGAMTLNGALATKKAIVLHGPPGTGKTYEAMAAARRFIKARALQEWKIVKYLEKADELDDMCDSQIRRLQLHQSWTYEQFIGGLKLTENGTEVEDGYLLKLVAEINESNSQQPDGLPRLPWVLVLDEINRVDLSRLLGEAFSAIEDRSTPIDLPGLDASGGRRSLQLPENLFIIGTMNLIDQSVEQLDFALRRRFIWFPAGFNPDLILEVVSKRWAGGPIPEKHPFERLESDVELLVERATLLNVEIAKSRLLGEQYEIGHTYFFGITDFLLDWPRLSTKKTRPNRYLWKKDGSAEAPTLGLWTFSLKPLLGEYLAGLDPLEAVGEVDRLEAIFLRGSRA